MNRQQILDFVRMHPTSFMATVEDGEPRVRAMQTAHVDDEGLVFCTGTHKDVCKQLLSNAAVELSYWSEEEGVQLRIRGQMRPVDSIDLKTHIVETSFTFLKPVVAEHGYESLGLFRLEQGEFRSWNRNAGGSEERGHF